VCLTNTEGRRANTWGGGANHWKVIANPWGDLGHSPVPRPTGSAVSVVGGSTAGTPGRGGPGVPASVGGSLAVSQASCSAVNGSGSFACGVAILTGC